MLFMPLLECCADYLPTWCPANLLLGSTDTRAVASPRIYGMDNWGDFFTARQKLTLAKLAALLRELPAVIPRGLRQSPNSWLLHSTGSQ